MLTETYQKSRDQVTKIQLVANSGAVIGSLFVGFGSQIVGRRFSIVMACTLGAALEYPYFFVSGPGLYAAVFFEQFFVQGVFGVVPIHLIELSPPAFRTFVVGTAYNLGVALAAPVPLVQTIIGQRYLLPPNTNGGTPRHDYRMGMAVFLGCAFFYTIVITFLGIENRENRLGLEEHAHSDGDDEYADTSQATAQHGKY